MQTDFLQYIYQAINTMLTQNLAFFDAMGQNLFRMFATILVVWYGVKMALAAASGHHLLHFEKLASLILTISFGFGMINYYNRPIPGMGSSFHNLITNEAQFLSNKIDQNQLQLVIDGVSNFETRLDSPTFGDLLGAAIYVLIILLLAAAQAVTIVVVAFGFIATAVCVLVGPIFIPFFIVPEMEWLFWGWFKAFLQYAFYQVIAAAVVFIIANLLVGTLRLPPAGTLSTVQLMAWFPVLLITFLAAIYALLKVPVLTNHIFSGASGGSSGAILGFLAGRFGS
ncbi:MAG TPA: type IV secretion system protein [Patescibacteria group bacterium]|nr:type IV secretion system protein [Patescibacteria group bacterium]